MSEESLTDPNFSWIAFFCVTIFGSHPQWGTLSQGHVFEFWMWIVVNCSVFALGRGCGILRNTVLFWNTFRSLELVFMGQLAGDALQSFSTMRLPSPALLYDARITIDMCSMLFAREVILSRAAERARPWIIHLRADSSPQFGRDFLVSQLDYVQFGTSCRDTVITKRLLPMQCIGSRSAGSHQKLEKLLFALTLESEQVSQQSAASILSIYK